MYYYLLSLCANLLYLYILYYNIIYLISNILWYIEFITQGFSYVKSKHINIDRSNYLLFSLFGDKKLY